MRTLRLLLLVWSLYLGGCTPAGGTGATGRETLAQAYIWAQRVCSVIGAAQPYMPQPAQAPLDGGVP